MDLLNTEILINQDDSIMDLQLAFNTSYPFLKIDFTGSDAYGRSLKNGFINPATIIKQLTSIDELQKINISSYRTVAEVLNDFQQMLGVLAEMSRKCGIVWNKISITSEWTLESQNDAGKFISSEMTRP